jgi:hypothetical protein
MQTESEISVSNENKISCSDLPSNNSDSVSDSVVSKIQSISNILPRSIEKNSLLFHFTLQEWNKFLSMTTCVKRLSFKVEFTNILSIKLQQAGILYLFNLISQLAEYI